MPKQRAFLLPILFAAALLPGCRAAEPGPPPELQSAALPVLPAASAVPPAFVNAAGEAGLHYRWTIAGKRPCNILQTIGNGCAFLDYNADGKLDVLLVGPRLALYRGDGRGGFTDVTLPAGLRELAGHFLGCAVGDYDNDGFEDVYISGYRCGALLHNEGGRRFIATTEAAGIASQPWGSSCSFLDADNDGRLDLYIGNYVRFGPETQPQLCDLHGFLTSCGPGSYAAERGVMYRNLGAGRFQDVTRAWNLGGVSGKALGVAAAPLDGDRVLAVANDQVPGDLLFLRGRATINRGKASGMAVAGDGRVYGGMGIDWGDYDGDGRLDLAVATFQNQAKIIFRNRGDSFVAQDSDRLRMHSAVALVAFGARWLDFDNDGWLDLMFTNGHVQDNIADVYMMNGPQGGAVFRQPTRLFRNLRGKEFDDVSERLAGTAGRPIVGRGLAAGDYDNDGRIDALAVDSDGAPVLLHNVTSRPGSWLLVGLVGKNCNRDGYGALVTAEIAGRRLVRHCHADGSYLSSSDPRVHFGLGSARRVDRLEVRWPDGRIDRYRDVGANRVITLREGDSPISRIP